MEPYLPEHTIIYYGEPITSDFNAYLNKQVVVKLKTGELYLKLLKRGFGYGKYSLMSYNAKLIEDVEIEWCAKVEFIKPV